MPCSYKLQGWFSKLITVFYLFVEIYHLYVSSKVFVLGSVNILLSGNSVCSSIANNKLPN
nr:MAG TPA: hypothetical protein [Caudoviricetes sp.]